MHSKQRLFKFSFFWEKYQDLDDLTSYLEFSKRSQCLQTVPKSGSMLSNILPKPNYQIYTISSVHSKYTQVQNKQKKLTLLVVIANWSYNVILCLTITTLCFYITAYFTTANLVSVTLYLVMCLIAHSSHFGSQLWHGVLLCIYFAIANLSHNFTLYPMQPIPMQLFCNVTLYFAIAASLFLVIVILCFATLLYFLLLYFK